MPTSDLGPRFRTDYARLTPEEKRLFRNAVAKFVADLRRRQFRKGLRVRGLAGHQHLYEMTWAPDGRAVFRFGDPVLPGEPHVIWLRIGDHSIFNDP